LPKVPEDATTTKLPAKSKVKKQLEELKESMDHDPGGSREFRPWVVPTIARANSGVSNLCLDLVPVKETMTALMDQVVLPGQAATMSCQGMIIGPVILGLILPALLEMVFLPTYSPHLNLIERLWCLMRKYVTKNQFYSHWGIPYWNAIMRFCIFLVNVYMLSRLKGALETERMLSRIDPLTGIINGKYFIELVNNEILRSSTPNHPFTIAYVDIDNFKAVNDRFGHTTGDTVLRTIAVTMRNHARKTDVIARLGGDEFAFLLPEAGHELPPQGTENSNLCRGGLRARPLKGF
jgi:GGDEF domain-containing protein